GPPQPGAWGRSFWYQPLQNSEQFESEDQRQRQADTKNHTGAFLGRDLVDTDVQVENQITDTGAKVMEIPPHQHQEYQFHQRITRIFGDLGVAFGRGHTGREQRQNDQGKTDEQQRAADAVQDGQFACQGQAVFGDLCNANIA